MSVVNDRREDVSLSDNVVVSEVFDQPTKDDVVSTHYTNTVFIEDVPNDLSRSVVQPEVCIGVVNYDTRFISSGAKPQNRLLQAIMATVWFFPTGILAILYALQANKLTEEGNWAEAESKSVLAQLTSVISVVFGVLFMAAVMAVALT